MTGPGTDPRRPARRSPSAAAGGSGAPSETPPEAGREWNRRRFLAWALGAGAAAMAVPLLPFPRGTVAPRGAVPETARCWRAMGTLLEVRIPDLPPRDAVAAVGRVRARVEALEAAMTLYRPESPLVAFNRSAPGRWREVPEALAEAVAGALAEAGRSGGAYDPTVAPMMRAWGLLRLKGRAAPPAVLRAWRRRPGAAAVVADAANRRLRRLDRRAEVDLGGMGKGIAVDAALEELARAGSRSALVNLGGSIGVLGVPPDRPAGWPVGIAHPRRPGEVWTTLDLAAGHLATSGDYERRVSTPAGPKHHLLDPESGEPTAGVASVTVWGESGTAADLASTATLVALARSPEAPGPGGDWLALLDRPGGLEARRRGWFSGPG